METFEDVVNEVLRYGFDDGPQVNKGRIEGWVNEALKQIVRKVDAPKFLTKTTVSLVAGTYEYELPADFLRMVSIRSEAERRLLPFDVTEFDTMLTSEGVVNRYALYGNKLLVWPTPSAAEKLTLRYAKNPAYITSGATVPELDRDYLHLLVDYATAKAFESEDDYEAANQRWQRYERDLAKFASDVSQRQDDRAKQLAGTWGQ